MKILIVDNSSIQRKMIANIIHGAGFNNDILEADNGKTAIGVVGVNYNNIGLILCGWNMPVMSGFEFVAGMGKVQQLSHIPIIMVTTEGTEEKIKQAYSVHPNLAGYIVKPFTPDQLMGKIAPLLKRDVYSSEDKEDKKRL